MSKKFDAEAYVEQRDAKIVPIMLTVIGLSLIAVIVLNVKTRPSCLRHEYIFCGTEEVLQEDKAHHGHHGTKTQTETLGASEHVKE